MISLIITAIDLDQLGPQERVQKLNPKIVKNLIAIFHLTIITTRWAVANVEAFGANPQKI